jgi:hypothetical protein
MDYQDTITTVSEIVNNEKIIKDGLTLIYELTPLNHKQLDEHLYYTHNPRGTEFEHQEVIEIELGGILIKFIEKGSKLEIRKDV